MFVIRYKSNHKIIGMSYSEEGLGHLRDMAGRFILNNYKNIYTAPYKYYNYLENIAGKSGEEILHLRRLKKIEEYWHKVRNNKMYNVKETDTKKWVVFFKNNIPTLYRPSIKTYENKRRSDRGFVFRSTNKKKLFRQR